MATQPKDSTTIENETADFEATTFLGIITAKQPHRACFRLRTGEQYVFPQYEFVSARFDGNAHEPLLFLEYRRYLVLLRGQRLDLLNRAIALDQVFAIEETEPTDSQNHCAVTNIEIATLPSPDEDDDTEK